MCKQPQANNYHQVKMAVWSHLCITQDVHESCVKKVDFN